MKWNVVTDSSCDLLPSSYQSDVIELSSVPFVITVGDQHFVDDEDLDLQKCSMIWNRKRKLVTLRAGSWNVVAALKKASHTFAITISSQLSGSMNSALTAMDMALEEHPEKKIAVLDSKSTGPELVLCVHELERLAREGVDFDEAVARANTFERTKILFALSSFDNLIKSGRMGKMTGFLARALGMWGIGTASEEGTIVVEGKARGTKKAVRELIKRMKERGFAVCVLPLAIAINPSPSRNH